jgi:hypothetical protein
MLAPRAVVVHRATELEELTARHGTRRQVEFFLRSRGRSIEDLELRHAVQQDALQAVSAALPHDWRRGIVERSDLARFVFGAEDIIVAVGQDGLVANVAKYLAGQPVLGLNPEPDRNPGVLVRHPPQAAKALLADATNATGQVERRAMVEAVIDDGQALRALNEIYIGHPSHQSARYRLGTAAGHTERQSSSGVLVGTGTGATGWCRSAALERRSTLVLPTPTSSSLCWFVREAWPSPATATALTEGILDPDHELVITAESDLVLFGDGIEHDAVPLTWGQRAVVHLAQQTLNLVV